MTYRDIDTSRCRFRAAIGIQGKLLVRVESAIRSNFLEGDAAIFIADTVGAHNCYQFADEIENLSARYFVEREFAMAWPVSSRSFKWSDLLQLQGLLINGEDANQIRPKIRHKDKLLGRVEDCLMRVRRVLPGGYGSDGEILSTEIESLDEFGGLSEIA